MTDLSAQMLPPPFTPSDGVYAIAEAAERRLAALARLCSPEDLRQATDAAILLECTMPGRSYASLPPELFRLAGNSRHFSSLLAAALLAGMPTRRIHRMMPDAIVPGLTREAMRILSLDAPSLDNDGFRKDLSICLLLSFPCVAQIVEETGTVPRRALTPGDARRSFRLLEHFARTGFRAGPYLEIHTHTPMLDGFNPPGWEECYALTADLLRTRPGCLGLIGGSWFYDPALADISPRLSYLADTPIEGGAFRVRLGASQVDTELATATSATRRQLVAEGRYTPTRWLLVWPRAALLKWADAHQDAG